MASLASPAYPPPHTASLGSGMSAVPTVEVNERPEGVRARPAAEVPGPRIPRLAQTLLGVLLPVEARTRMRERYGGVFKSNDAIVGELFHIADRGLIEQVFKWKPAQY